MSEQHYYLPKIDSVAFTCPLCGVYSKQNWYFVFKNKYSSFDLNAAARGTMEILLAENIKLAQCNHCNLYSIWTNKKMVYPLNGMVPLPMPDMPDDVKKDYLEAREIVSMSPKGAAALLRLAIHKLCKHLGEEGQHIFTDIGSLVSKGLRPDLQKALDSVRVIGNNAVHPGQINIDDTPEIATQLFLFINIIVRDMITTPKEIGDFYNLNIPDDIKKGIAKRDGEQA